MNAQSPDRIRFVTQHFNDLQGLRILVPVGLITLSQGVMSFYPAWPLLVLYAVTVLGSLTWMLRSGRYYRRTFGEVEQRREELGMEGSSLSIYSPAGAALSVRTPLVKPAVRVLGWTAIAFTLVFLLRAAVPSAILTTDGSGVDPWVQLHPPVVMITDGPEMPRSLSDLKPILGQSMYAIFGTLFLTMWFLWKRRLPQIYYLVMGALLLGLAVLGVFLGPILSKLWELKIIGIARFFLPPLAHLWLAQILCGASLLLAGLLDHWQIARVLRPMREEA